MEPITIGILGIVALLILLGLGVHIGIAMMAVGLTGLWAMGMPGVLSHAGGALFYATWKYEYAVMPLFILMSAFAAQAGIAQMAYNALYKWFYRLPGSLCIATTFGCAMFGAVSGSSMATSAVFGRIALPTMNEYGYDKRLSLGSIAASGTFACMIPPSTLFVLYGIFTETSIGRLFLSGVVPGLLTAAAYAASIVIRCIKNPELAPSPEGVTFTNKEKIASLKDGLPILGIAAVVLGGTYAGYFTITEAAAVGCIITFITGVLKVGWKEFDLHASLQETAHTTATIFFVIIGAYFFARFLTITRIPVVFSTWLISLPLPRELVILGIFAMFFLLGMIIVPSGIMAITLPVVFPVVVELGYDPVWFGVICMKASEIAAVTPPVGLNVYVLKGVVGKGATLEEIFSGIWPFVIVDMIMLVLLILFPSIALWLPNLIMG